MRLVIAGCRVLVRPRLRRSILALLGAGIGVIAFMTSQAAAVLPVSGWPVPSLANFDNAVQNYMNQKGLSVGVVAVSRNGTIVYQRGFGHLRVFPSVINLPENTPMRLASCTKPITSAAIRQLVTANILHWNDFIFNLGQPGTCLLTYSPWNGVGDNRLDDIRLQHVFDHKGGWDINTMPNPWTNPPNQPGMDPVFESINIANSMGVGHPAGRDNTIRFMLSRPLQFTPGTNGCLDSNNNPIFCYSNFGYMLLGEVIEKTTALSTIDYVRQNVLTPNLWVPSTEIFPGRTFGVDQSAREPGYVSSSTCYNVFDGGASTVSCPYGGWNHESFVGFGNLVASAMPLLVYMNWYQVGVGGAAGTPLSGQGWTTAPGSWSSHTGGLDGTSTIMYQRGDGINIVVLFNDSDPNDDFAAGMAQTIANVIDGGGFSWPTTAVDGTWVDFTAFNNFPVGGYDLPYLSMQSAVANVTHGTKLRVKPGTSTWTGTLTTKLLIDAPLGTARIGG